MKVLHVIPSVAPRDGGPSRAVVDMCWALRGQGADALIATTDADGSGRLPVELNRRTTYQEVPAIFFPRQWSEAYKYSRPLACWLDAHVREFDVVHIHAIFSHACLAAARACRRSGVPYIMRPLGTLDPWSVRQKPLRKKLFWHFGVRRMLDGAAAIHYTAQPEQTLAEEAFGLTRGVVIPLGVELPTPDELRAQEDGLATSALPVAVPYVLVLSRLHQKKGLELLLPAFLALIKRRGFADWRLVLAGDGAADYVASLRQLVRAQGGDAHVLFAGWLDGARRQATLQQAALLALTSYQENFGLCVVEAWACGVPVLVSPHVNLAPEIEAAGAGWIAPLERDALEQVLADALGDAAERARRGALGRNLVSTRFAWSAIAVRLCALYDAVAKNAHGESARLSLAENICGTR
jgi:glycosyltransferase involved in cell wall biosynthesis